MKVVGIGADIVEAGQVQGLLAGGTDQLAAIFTCAEIQYCETKRRKVGFYAARLAAKTAFVKALPAGGAAVPPLREIEVVHDERGQPQLSVHGTARALLDENCIHGAAVSLSHSCESAIAVIILQGT